MCGRFSLSTPAQTLAEIFEVANVPELQPRFNIAPSEAIAAIRVPRDEQARELARLRWGLVPSWAKEPSVGNRMINARAETVGANPAFRSPFRRRRCLIPADGFFEWQRLERGKQPFHFRMRDGLPFAFAGLWDLWEGKHGSVIESCTLITTQPNDLVRPVHDRMPVIVEPKHYELWLDPRVDRPERLMEVLQPFAAGKMVTYPVSNLVNNPANDDPACIAPLPADQG